MTSKIRSRGLSTFLRAKPQLRRAAIALLSVLTTTSFASDVSSSALLARAETAVSEANRIAAESADRAAEKEREAAAAYRSLIVDHGYDTPSLHRNLGAIEVRLGNLGRGIASLRRAQRLDPADAATRETLQAARSRVGSLVEDRWQEQGVAALLFWRSYIAPVTVTTLAIAAWAVAWLAFSIRVTTGSRRFAATGFGFLGIAVILGASVGLERWVTSARRSCVVVTGDAMALRGPSEAIFEPVFEQPLSEGIEARVLEERDDWVRLRLASGSECWVPRASIEMI